MANSLAVSKKINRRLANNIDSLSNVLHPIIHKIYAARGVTSIQDLNLGLESLLLYRNLHGVLKAADTIVDVIANSGRILVIGNESVGSLCGLVLAITVLKSFDCKNVDYIIIDSEKYGYSLTSKFTDELLKLDSKPNLIITTAVGINNYSSVKFIESNEIKVIIADCNEPFNRLPEAHAIISPHLEKEKFGSEHLSAAGLVFYLMLAVRAKLKAIGWFDAKKMVLPKIIRVLDLVAIGTIADNVQLDRNNRVLLKHGIDRIKLGTASHGVNTLLAAANKSYRNTTEIEILYSIIPRLKRDFKLAAECLLTETDKRHAKLLAKKLDILNSDAKFQDLQRNIELANIFKDTLSEIENKNDCIIQIAEISNKESLRYLVRKLVDYFSRPILLFTDMDKNSFFGYLQSVEGIHACNIFNKISSKYVELLHSHEGNSTYTNLILPKDRLDDFKAIFNEELEQLLQSNKDYLFVYTDGEIHSSNITASLVDHIAKSGPWGYGFPEPTFDGIFQVCDRKLMKNRHFKLKLKAIDTNQKFNAIAFDVSGETAEILQNDELVKCAYKISVNNYRGKKNTQIIVEHAEKP